jgi:serine/threonine-protein kinase
MSNEQWLDVAAAILDGTNVAWDAVSSNRADDPPPLAALRLIADVAQAHRTERWGPFELLEKIGHGTSGDVYRVRDTALDRDVALKLLAYTPTSAALEEGKLLARVHHPNVVTVHGAAAHDGRYGIWMELVRGRTLGAILDEHGPLPWRDVATIGADVCAALAAVHNCGLLHGDVKTRNVMREEGGRIVLMDFGTGRFASDPLVRFSGTPLYMAPEVLDGSSPDVRSDIYSAGVLLYYMATGEHPIQGATLQAIRAAHHAGHQVPIRDRQRRCPRALAAIITRATCSDPARRFQTAEALESALRRALQAHAASLRAALFTAGAVMFGLVAIGAWPRIASRPADRASLPDGSNQRLAQGPVTADFVGTWDDTWTEGLCGYACGTPPGGGGTTTLVLMSDTAPLFTGGTAYSQSPGQ